MLCKVCNTRLGQGDRHCPNCGQDAPAEAAFARTSPPSPLPKVDLSASQEDLDPDEIELDELSGDSPRPQRASARRGERPPAPRPTPRRDPGASGSAIPPVFTPDAASLRKLLAETPETLEPGLESYRDEKGRAAGSGYISGVGEIDLLARGEHGELVVVMISETGHEEELIAEVLQRIGWVRKHVGAGKEQVRGIVLCKEPPEELSYAAAAVAGTVSFKTYRLALTFEDLDL